VGKRCFTIALIFLCILGEPVFWNSNAIAQQRAVLQPSKFKSNELNPGNTAIVPADSFVVDVQSLLKAPGRGSGETFHSPNFVTLAYSPERLRGPKDREALRTPMQVAALFPRQDSAASPSAQSTTTPSGGSSSPSKKKSNKLIWILVAAGGGTAAALLVMKKSSGDSGSSYSGGNATTITVGPPIVVGP